MSLTVLFFFHIYIYMLIDTDVEFVPGFIIPDSKVLELILKYWEEGGTEKAL